jgi:hypothetical protein
MRNRDGDLRAMVRASIGVGTVLSMTSATLAQQEPARQPAAPARAEANETVAEPRRMTGATAREFRELPPGVLLDTPEPTPRAQRVPIPRVVPAPRRPLPHQVVQAPEGDDEAGADAEAEPRGAFPAVYFDRFILGGQATDEYRRGLVFMLDRRIDQATAEYALKPDQERMLQLAGQGSIKRHLDLIESLRAEWNVARMDRQKGRAFIINARRPTGLTRNALGDDSLFGKALIRLKREHEAARAAAAAEPEF